MAEPPPPTPPRPAPPAGAARPADLRSQGPSPLGKDIPENEALRRARTIRIGAMVMAALWEE
jgi:hypothetical protein